MILVLQHKLPLIKCSKLPIGYKDTYTIHLAFRQKLDFTEYHQVTHSYIFYIFNKALVCLLKNRKKENEVGVLLPTGCTSNSNFMQ